MKNKMKKSLAGTYLSLVLIVALLGACSTDFEVNAPPKEVAMVYCLLDRSAPFQVARISRLFQNRNQDARDIARNIPDSSNYNPDDLQVMLFGIRNSDTLQRIEMYDTLYTDKDLNGDFYAPNQLVYKTRNITLDPALQYTLKIKNVRTGYQTQANTDIVSEMSIQAPNPNSNIQFRTVEVNPNFTNNKTAVRITGDNRTAVGYGDYVMYFDEYYNDGTIKPDSVTWENFVVLDLSQEPSTGRFRLIGEYFDDTFIAVVGSILQNRPQNAALTERRIKNLKIKVVTGNVSVQEYILVAGGFSSITQAKPIYTNFTNGLGIFGSILRQSFTYNTAIGGVNGTDMILRKRFPELKF
jgi:hypothetical protein